MVISRRIRIVFPFSSVRASAVDVSGSPEVGGSDAPGDARPGLCY
jgi:hypothetical protein